MASSTSHIDCIVMVCTLFCCGIAYWLTATSRAKAHNFERVGKPWILQMLPGQGSMTWTIDKYVEDGYIRIQKLSNQPFMMTWWAQQYIFLPPKYLGDIKRADSHSLSFLTNLSDAFSLHNSVGDLYSTDIMIEVITKRLNPQLPSLVPFLADECAFAFDMELGNSNDWKDFNAAKLLGKIIHRVTSRVLMGEELCRNNQYLCSSAAFSESVFMNAVILSMFPMGPFRGVGSWLGTFFHRRKLEKAVKMVLPIVEQRMAERAREGKASTHLDAMSWTMELSESIPRENNSRRITLQLLHNLWAGSAAPGGLVTQMLFQTLMNPKYVEPLRTESEKAISNCGWSEKALNNMPLLESFIKEINRLYPTGSITCARTIMDKPFEFHDGLILPAGSRIAITAMAIQRDPDNFQNPLVFDGFRFARLDAGYDGLHRKPYEDEHRGSAVAISTTNLAFGYGKHACPGRFYAVRKAKLIFSRLLLEYEIKWANQVSVRPPSLSINGQFAPNQEQMISIRRR